MIDARQSVIARRESGIVYINSLPRQLSTQEADNVVKEAINAAELAGERVVFVDTNGTMSWFA